MNTFKYCTISRLFLVVVFVGCGLSASFVSYNPDTYPDSLRDWTLCKVPEPSLVCDPNQLLNPAADGNDGVIMIHKALQHLRSASNCSCEEVSTEFISGSDPPRLGSAMGTCDSSNPHGYTLSVAILKKILVDPKSRRTIEELISVFANALRNRLSRGQCQDDAFIVFSVDDSAVWTSTGSNIAKKLSPEFITSVSRNSQEYFARDDYTGAFLYMINQYSQQLEADPDVDQSVHIKNFWWERNVWSKVPKAWSSSSWRWWILVLLVLFLVLFLIGLVYTVYTFISRPRHHHNGYYLGRQQGVKH